MKDKKFLILGHGRHGKDTVAEMMREMYGISYASSSWAAAEIAVYPALRERHGYRSLDECYADRASHREEWRQLITDYNTPDKSKLCREILGKNDCYVGMRCPLEYAASKDLFDYVIWVDASMRLPPDPTMGIELDCSMLVVDNNGGLRDLCGEVAMLRALAA